MTVSYNLDVSSTSTTLGFLKLQFRWRGSIWKSVMKELTLFLTAFAVILTIYRTDHFLTEQQRMFWDEISKLFDERLDYIPLTFMLGFFVSIIVGRWNQIFSNMGWIENTALLVATYLRGSDEKSRMMRRNVIRYMVLTQVLVYRDISMQVRRRLPTLDTVVASGFMTEAERDKYVAYNNKYVKVFLPIQWCYSVIHEARMSGKLCSDLMMNEIIKNVAAFRQCLEKLCHFDWVPIPLVYPQVVFLAVRVYFLLCLVARQSVLIDGKHRSSIFPIIPLLMTSLQFIFYVGWMKVAESLMNPLGEDDDDFECNYLLDRNLSLGLSIVDECYNDLPLQEKDIFWSAETIEPLYSADTAVKPINPQVGSAVQYDPPRDEVIMMPRIDTEDLDNISFDDQEARLLPRGVSVVSVNRHCGGSRSSLVSKKSVFENFRKQFSRDGRKISRPTHLDFSHMSVNSDMKLSAEQGGESSLDILGEMAEEAARNSLLLTPDGDLSPTSPSRRSPVALTSVPEEDEESQKTRNSVDLQQWKEEAKEQFRKRNEQ
ncbi:Bestrophin [Trichostrongylus colubriformis]|uniref:Bestrophin homolog n=1 Tax=Trichostrongylus colubriformis TaxID=6319 RepID=A0AAN8IPT0_TRICO